MKKYGFTLAEVLITLGIIGVVASMTLPALIQNYNHLVLKSQFQKAYSVAQQVVLMAKTESGAGQFAKYCADISDEYREDPEQGIAYPNSPQCHELLNKAFLNKSLTVYTHQDKTGEYTVKRPVEEMRTYNNQNTIQVAGAGAEYWTVRRGRNGMYMQFRINEGTMWLTIDTNGKKKPNRLGHDIFTFYVDKKKDALTGLKQNKAYTQEELDNMEGTDWQKDRAGNPCSINSNQKQNGNGCSWYAINDINPDTNKQGYWKNLPK